MLPIQAVAPLGIEIDGFPNATQVPNPQIPAHFALKFDHILLDCL